MKLICGDCLEEMKGIADGSIDAVITDPPYELGFMGKAWDRTGITNSVPMWSEVLRVLKPGGYLLSFGGTRTYHRMASAIENAGFEVRDMIEWVYGSGFPKSLNIGKSIPEWEGWGTALKPAHEPICMARKPLSEKTVVKNVLKHGAGGINIDASRVETSDNLSGGAYSGGERSYGEWKDNSGFRNDKLEQYQQPLGRFPANLIHDDSEEVRVCFPGISNSSSRFFKSIIYTAKASKSERNKGCEGLEQKQTVGGGGGIGNYLEDVNSASGKFGSEKAPSKNNHPTVKPIALMEYLLNMVSKEGDTILDPFMGSGTTGIASRNLNRNFIGIELDKTYFEIARERTRSL